MMNRTTKILLGIIGLLLIALYITDCRGDKAISEWRRKYTSTQQLVKEGDGKYARIVTEVSKEKELRKILKEELEATYNRIREDNEKILYYQHVIATFKGKRDTVEVINLDSSTIAFKLFYPNEEECFIKYSGEFKKFEDKIFGEWSFSKLNLSVILTEQEDETWKSRIVGPDYFVVDSMQVFSLPKEEIAQSKKFKTLLGGGIGRDFINQNLLFGASVGIDYKNKISLQLLGTTNQNAFIILSRKF